jgi:hypothetical protein
MLGFLQALGDEGSCNNTEMYKTKNTSEARCDYVSNNDDCHGESVINYYTFFFCNLNESYVGAVLISV